MVDNALKELLIKTEQTELSAEVAENPAAARNGSYGYAGPNASRVAQDKDGGEGLSFSFKAK